MSYGPNFTYPLNWIQNSKNICPMHLDNLMSLN